ncbi:MAG: (2Fe-2S) ferredoxin domain-containing protein [Treponema sp.]|nr:(2Fe-2S) ferredoxin domain-containing protein [Treponema sp.]
MPKMTLDELRKLRESTRMDIIRRESEGKEIQVIVAMGTCGIATGAKAVLDTFITSLDEHKLVETVMVRQTGCMGICGSEPTVEVAVPGMAPVIYGKVDSAVAKEIIVKHLVGRQTLDNYVVAKPSEDTISTKGGGK